MFTGLIEEIGEVLTIDSTNRGTQLQVVAPRLAEKTRVGESIAVNGCCLTVVAAHPPHLTFDLLRETTDRTNLKTLRATDLVNLERALAANGSLGGHFVQGHVDCVAPIIAWERIGDDHRLEVALLPDFARYVVSK